MIRITFRFNFPLHFGRRSAWLGKGTALRFANQWARLAGAAEEGAATRKLHALEEPIGRLVAQLADFVGEEVRTQIRQAALLARRARPPQNETEQVLLQILAPALESTGGLHSQLVDTVFSQALRGAACCCRTDQDARRVRDFVQDLQQQTSRTDKQISSMIFGLGLPAV